MVKCESCTEEIKDEPYVGDEGTSYEGKTVCENCYCDNEPCATIVRDWKRDDPQVITSARNETESDFQVSWHLTDPWRGYYQCTSESHVKLNDDAILSGHESERMLKDFDDKLKELFKKHNIKSARVFTRSSNVFMTGYEVWVNKGQVLEAGLLVIKARRDVDYDNPKYKQGIIFDAETLNKVQKLFPEKNITTDSQVLELIEKGGDAYLDELQKRVTSESTC